MIVTEPTTTYGAVVCNNGNVSGNFFPDLRKAFRHLSTLVGATYVGAPIGTPQPGSVLYLDFTQDGTGSRVITWDPVFRDAPAWGSSGAVGATAVGEFRFTSQGSWQYVGGSSAWAVQGEGMPTPSGTMALGGSAPTLGGGITIAPTVGSVAVSGVASSVQKSTVMTPVVAALNIVGQLATESTYIEPTVGSVSISGQQAGRTP